MIDTQNFWLSDTEARIKEIANTPTNVQSSRTSAQFMEDIQKTMADWVYANQNEAIRGVLDYANSKSVSYEGIDTDAIFLQLEDQAPEVEDKSLFDRFGETLERRWEAWADILTRGVTWDTWAIEWGLLFWANFLWTLADLTGDALAEGFTELDEFGDAGSMQKALMSGIQTISETSGGKVAFNTLLEAQSNLETLQELDPVKWARFQWALDTINGVLTLAWGSAAKTWVKQTGRVTKDILKQASDLWDDALRVTWAKIKDVSWRLSTKADDRLLSKLDLETVKGKIGDIEVDIPKQKKGLVETATTPFREADTKVLAGRALSPRTVGKNAKQKLQSIADVEKHSKKFYENVRTWVLKWNIDTIEDAAQTVVDNIDTVWARIGNAVKKVDWFIDVDEATRLNINIALNAKGAKISPATNILKQFADDIGDGNLSVTDAFELKKLYGNEVSKLYKSWDAGTKQFKALSDAVKWLNTKIDDIIDTKLGSEFAKDKEIFRSLKTIVDDLVNSTLVEGRRSPNTFSEQIGMIQGLLSPIESTKQVFIKEIANLNTRGWSWKELIKVYDQRAIKSFADVRVPVKVNVPAEIKAIPVNTAKWIDEATSKVLAWITVSSENVKAAWKIIREFITKHGEDFKNRLWELLDDLADKVWARSKFIDDTNFKDFSKVWTTKSAIKQTKDTAKKRFNLKELKQFSKEWEGTDRIVFDLWDGTVLKVAKNPRGIDQNLNALNKKLQDAWIIPDVKEVWKDFVIMQKVKQFNQLNASEQKIVNNLVKDVEGLLAREADVTEIKKVLSKYWWEEIGNLDIKTFGWGDIKPKNLSVVNGKPVLLDEGTINLITTLKKYKRKVLLAPVKAWAIVALMTELDAETLYDIGWRLFWWDILKSNSVQENTKILVSTPRG